MSSTGDTGVRARLRAALRAAMKARDVVAVGALRSAIAAIENAEAVDAEAVGLSEVQHERIAGTVGPLGTAEAPREALDEDAARAVVTAEIAQRRAAAILYERHGHDEQAMRLRDEADMLDELLLAS